MPPVLKKSTQNSIISLDDSSDSSPSALPTTDPVTSNSTAAVPGYIVELAKSGRAECRKCDCKIGNKTIRIGVTLEGDWGLFTRWQHLSCTIFHRSLVSCENIEGYNELSSADQLEVQKRFEDSKGEVDEDMKPLNDEDLVRQHWSEAAEPSDDLLMPLLPYQKEGLGWMLNQEKNSVHGGILADEMGMGKTIQAVSLILRNRPDSMNQHQAETWRRSDHEHERNSDVVHCGTLVVVPTVAIRQWQMEIVRFTRENALRVKIYHGNDRNMTLSDLSTYDVIITSYKVLEIEYRKATAGTKVECRICGKRFYPEKLRVHRKYFCGEGAQRTAGQSKTQKKNVQSTGRNKAELQSSADDSDNDDESDFIPTSKKNVRSKKQVKSPSSTSHTHQRSTSSSSASIPGKRSTPTRAASKSAITKMSTRNVESQDDESDYVEGSLASSESDNDDDDDDDSSLDFPSKQRKSRPTISKSSTSQSDKKRRNSQTKELYFHENSTEDSNCDGKTAKNKVSTKSRASTQTSKANAKTAASHLSKKRNKKFSSTIADSEQEDELEVTVASSQRSRASVTKTNKKKFPGEQHSSEDEKAHANSNKRVGKLAARKRMLDHENDSDYDEEVERDIREAINAHKKTHSKNSPRSLLHDVSWFRIILDEAHLIKDRSTSTAKAVFNLCSLYKWCLTGTPLQNRVGELYSLIRFLRLDPHAFYYCRSKECSCKSLHYRFTNSHCDECGHSVIHHFCHFNKHILNPIQRSGFVAEGRKAMLKLKKEILDNVLLRRTKTNRADDISLPMRIVRVRQEKMDEKEEDIYQSLYTQSQAQFNTYLASDTVLNNYAHIFDILIRLRQAVDHPYLVIHSDRQRENGDLQFSRTLNNDSTAQTTNSFDSNTLEEDCVLCSELAVDCVQAACGHCYCRSCLLDYMNTISSSGSSLSVLCAQCQQPLTVQLSNKTQEVDNSVSVWNADKRRRKSILDKIDLNSFQTSTKMEALMEELYYMEQNDPGAKAIVFSQFVNMLDLLEYRLQRGGVSCVKLSGSLTVDQRDKIITSFKEDPSIKVFLISLKAGGFALNLTVANHIFLMDPWWNPAAEFQAIDRTHRIGQYKPIFATRFIIEDSIEERILRLQEKKKLVFDSTVGGDVASMTKLTVDDMRFLFQ